MLILGVASPSIVAPRTRTIITKQCYAVCIINGSLLRESFMFPAFQISGRGSTRGTLPPWLGNYHYLFCESYIKQNYWVISQIFSCEILETSCGASELGISLYFWIWIRYTIRGKCRKKKKIFHLRWSKNRREADVVTSIKLQTVKISYVAIKILLLGQ